MVTGTVVILIETAIGTGTGTITSTSTSTGFCSEVGASMGIGIGGACAFFLTCTIAIANGHELSPPQHSIANACGLGDKPKLHFFFWGLVTGG